MKRVVCHECGHMIDYYTIKPERCWWCMEVIEEKEYELERKPKQSMPIMW